MQRVQITFDVFNRCHKLLTLYSLIEREGLVTRIIRLVNRMTRVQNVALCEA